MKKRRRTCGCEKKVFVGRAGAGGKKGESSGVIGRQKETARVLVRVGGEREGGLLEDLGKGRRGWGRRPQIMPLWRGLARKGRALKECTGIAFRR